MVGQLLLLVSVEKNRVIRCPGKGIHFEMREVSPQYFVTVSDSHRAFESSTVLLRAFHKIIDLDIPLTEAHEPSLLGHNEECLSGSGAGLSNRLK